jgi:lipoteichoic acid synthase
MKQKIVRLYHNYFGFFLLAIVLTWAKTYISYHLDFSLGVKGWLQHLILLINPIAITVLLFSLCLFAKSSKRGHKTLIIIYLFNSLLLYANILYYREFSDFLTFSTMLGAKKISGGGSFATSLSTLLNLLRWYDFVYWTDIIVLLVLLIRRSVLISVDQRAFFSKRCAWRALAVSLVLFLVNLGLAEISRPGLLTRTFDRNYIVKYLGINGFTAYDSIQTIKVESSNEVPDRQEVNDAVSYANNRYVPPNPATFGIAEGRNVIAIHLESMQQFLIDYKLTDGDGKEWEVLPFLNELYHSSDTFSFPNLFTQIGQGKSSDAELMMETSLFGLPQGAAFIQYTGNVFYSMPEILRDKADYTSAAFHGNVGSFWNRTDMYKSLGYEYFFDADEFKLTEENSAQYGLKDKPFFQQSVKYLEQLQQPFYAKLVTLSNHFPFPPDEKDSSFPQGTTKDDSVNGYFATANYADQALREFFDYLKETGIYENSIFVLYGDHFGISDSRNGALASLLGRDPETWTEFDDAQMKRVPLLIHIPGYGQGEEVSTYGGQVDIPPTVLHMLGIDTKSDVMMGQDLLSPNKDQTITFRNGDIVSPTYTVIGENAYYTANGSLIPEDNTYAYSKAAEMKEDAEQQLSTSDKILESNLLDYYRPQGLTPVNSALYDYTTDWDRLMEQSKNAGYKNTSVYYRNGRVSTMPLYKTDVPKLKSKQDTTEETEKKD